MSEAQDCLDDIRKKLAQSKDDVKVLKTFGRNLALTETTLLLGPGGYILTRYKGVVLARFVRAELARSVKALLDKQPDLVYEEVRNLVLWVAPKNTLPSAAVRRQLGR